MAKIIFSSNGNNTTVDAQNGETLLETAARAGVELFGGCGGAGVCGSCHVYISPEYLPKLNEATFEEQDLLEALPKGKPNSRLACQVIISDVLDGMIVEIP